jgi:hypothetical protein
MEDFWLIVLGGFVLACLLWGITKFLKWARLLRSGVIADGHVWAHRQAVSHSEFGEEVQLFLMYTYDCNGTNYLHEEAVDSVLYNSLEDGDSVEVRCLPEDPMTAKIAYRTRFWFRRADPTKDDISDDF